MILRFGAVIYYYFSIVFKIELNESKSDLAKRGLVAKGKNFFFKRLTEIEEEDISEKQLAFSKFC